MLYFDRIDVSEGNDFNKSSESKSKECDICHYWFFLNKGSKFHPDVCNGCHDLLMMAMNLNSIVILNIKGADYYCVISGIRKKEAINFMQNIDLTKESRTL